MILFHSETNFQLKQKIAVKKWIKETSEKMLKEDFDIYKAISEEKSIINPDMMPAVFQASYLLPQPMDLWMTKNLKYS